MKLTCTFSITESERKLKIFQVHSAWNSTLQILRKLFQLISDILLIKTTLFEWVSLLVAVLCYYFATPRVDIKIPDFSLSFPLNFQISNICHLEIFVVSVFCLQVFRYAMDSNLINAYLQNKNVAQFLSNIFLVKLHNINRDMLRGLDKMDTRSILFLLMYLK